MKEKLKKRLMMKKKKMETDNKIIKMKNKEKYMKFKKMMMIKIKKR